MTAPDLPLSREVDVVVIGASAGGIDALLVLLNGLPAQWRLPLVVVIHLPESHESRLAEVFRQRLGMPVCEAQDKAQVAPGTLHFAPAGYHLSIERGGLFSLSCEPPVRWSRPSIDVLMASAADAYGPRVAGMVLTGANDDGAEGLLAIHRAGGLTAVQSPSEAQVDTMPQAAMARHTPNHVLSLQALHTLLLQLDRRYAP